MNGAGGGSAAVVGTTALATAFEGGFRAALTSK